jgi:uncharacterized protein with PIN domain
MSVPCPRCGREYDVTLFQFGRTIHCTCGSRVGLEPRVQRVSAGGEVRFMVDAMLGRLARWLRIIGCDAAFDAEIPDADLVRRALEEDRVILTRDRALPEEWRIPRVLIVESESLLDQLRQVTRAYGLDWRSRLFTRCSRCNTELEPASHDDVAHRVPERLRREQQHFFRCASCGRVYWSGSHITRMRRVLEQALGAVASPEPPSSA